MRAIIAFDYEKETKGAVRYKEITTNHAEPLVGTLYIRKSATIMSGKIPAKLTVTIDAS